MFAKREPDALRAKLASLREEARLGRISEDAFVQLSIEILLALQKLGEPLSADEQKTLRVHHENRDAYVENTGNFFSHLIFSRLLHTQMMSRDPPYLSPLVNPSSLLLYK